MGGVISILIGLFVAIVVLGLLFAAIGHLMVKFPFLEWIIALFGGVAICVALHWIVGIIAGFFIFGFLEMAKNSVANKCAHCGSYNTEVTSENGSFMVWYCKDCHNVTYKN